MPDWSKIRAKFRKLMMREVSSHRLGLLPAREEYEWSEGGCALTGELKWPPLEENKLVLERLCMLKLKILCSMWIPSKPARNCTKFSYVKVNVDVKARSKLGDRKVGYQIRTFRASSRNVSCFFGRLSSHFSCSFILLVFAIVCTGINIALDDDTRSAR